MATCKRCGKSSFFLTVDANGYCSSCAEAVKLNSKSTDVNAVVGYLLQSNHNAAEAASVLESLMMMDASSEKWSQLEFMARFCYNEFYKKGTISLLKNPPSNLVMCLFFWGISDETPKEERAFCADVIEAFTTELAKTGLIQAKRLKLLAIAYTNEMMRGLDLDSLDIDLSEFENMPRIID